MISYLFELPFITYLGNTSFGVYIMQQLLIDYKWKNDEFLLANKYPKILDFTILLTVMGAIGYHCIQLPYQPYIAKVRPSHPPTHPYTSFQPPSSTHPPTHLIPTVFFSPTHPPTHPPTYSYRKETPCSRRTVPARPLPM